MKPIHLFINSAGGILLAAALIRFFIALGNAQVLSLPDPLFGLPLRYAILLVGSAELLVALTCLFGKQTVLRLGGIAWLTTSLLLYEIGLARTHCHFQSTCIGDLNDPFHITGPLIGYIIGFIPLCFALASYGMLTWLWLGGTNEGKPQPIVGKQPPIPIKSYAPNQLVFARFLKIPCTACGGRIEFPTNAFGQKISCPHCNVTIILQKSKNVKMACPGCEEHIEFPSHATGQNVRCPHCKINIHLKELE